MRGVDVTTKRDHLNRYKRVTAKRSSLSRYRKTSVPVLFLLL